MDKLDSTAIGVGAAFFVMFWLITDNIGLGIGMGIALGAGVAVTRLEEKQQRNGNVDDPADPDTKT